MSRGNIVAQGRDVSTFGEGETVEVTSRSIEKVKLRLTNYAYMYVVKKIENYT